MARRLYLGRLPPDVRSDDVQKLFDGYGKIIDCRVMTGFGFVEFETSRDAEDALQQFNGKNFMGNNIVVEFAKESRPRRDPYDGDRPIRGLPRGGGRRPPGVRLVVDGISKDTSWQDLKDFGREAGLVSFADVDRDNIGQGILEYPNREDAEQAVKLLDGKDLRGQAVRVSLSEDRGGPDNFRRDRYRDDRYSRDDRYREDRYREDRYDKYRDAPRRRSASPVVRSRDDGGRSPPRRRDYDDRRGDPYDRRRDDRRRDDRDRESRYDDRPSRPAAVPAVPANGEGGWSR